MYWTLQTIENRGHRIEDGGYQLDQLDQLVRTQALDSLCVFACMGVRAFLCGGGREREREM